MAGSKLKPITLHPNNRFRCLLCYLICFALPIAWLLMALRGIYPYRLAGTAPNAAQIICKLLPVASGMPGILSAAQNGTAVDGSAAALQMAAQNRERFWLLLWMSVSLAAWFFTIVLQLIWRSSFHHSYALRKATARAIRRMRMMLLLVFALNAAAALVLWMFGVREITARTYWDYLAYVPALLMNLLAAIIVSRCAAPASISGKHAYFKRL